MGLTQDKTSEITGIPIRTLIECWLINEEYEILDIKIILANKKPTVQTVGFKLRKKSFND